MFVNTPNNSIAITIADAVDQLKAPKLVAVANLIKTSSGYSPLLLMDDADVVATLDLSNPKNRMLTVSQAGNITHEEDIASHPRGYCYFSGVRLADAVFWISQIIDVAPHEIYTHLLNSGGIARQARAEGYFFAETINTHPFEEYDGPYIGDGSNGFGAWNMMIPSDITIDELASIIKKQFCAIGGLVYNFREQMSVFLFFKDGYEIGDDADYRHCMSHIIDERGVESYSAPRTYGENTRHLIKLLEFFSNPSFEPSHEQTVEGILRDHTDMLLSNLGENQDAPFPLTNRYDDGTMQFITELSRGIAHFTNVPLELQIAACAKVAEVSEEGMVTKIYACTDSSLVA